MSTVPTTKKPRKPRTKKADMIKKKEMEAKMPPAPPKKRGRKPKGGKIIKNITPNIEPMVENKTVILHLKCKLSDLNKNDTITNKIDTYDPNIVMNIEPYHQEENYTFIDNEKQQDKTNEIPSNYEIMNKKLNSIQQVETSNNTNDDRTSNNIKENNKKLINMKLKELEKKLNTNNVNVNSACFWCTYEFNTPPIYIPSLYFKEKYDVYGCFCSPECACSHLFNENIDNNTKFERYQLLNYLYGKTYNYTKNIKPAPNPYYTLSKYYGNLSIQEYRQLLEFDRLLLVIDKPLTKMYPEIHEDNNDFETIYENKISLKKNSKIDKNKILSSVFTT